MDILVTFEDGATEMRAANSPLLTKGRSHEQTYINPNLTDVIDARDYWSDGRGWWLVTAADRLIDCCAVAMTLGARRGGHGWVWVITGGLGARETPTGEWRKVKVETVDEQLERLTRERDAAEKRLTDLRTWAEGEARKAVDATTHHVDAFDEAWSRAFKVVVARIDGKD